MHSPTTVTASSPPADVPSTTADIPSTTDLARSLGISLLRFSRSLRQRSDVELSPSLISALVAVRRHGPLTPSELADHERVKRPTATRFIACLEHAGLVSRTADPDDGRSYRVAVTQPGAELLISARRQQDAYLSERLELLDADELATLGRATGILERLIAEECR
ncbi:MAG TPA: MarR family transcriptional regulator [Solirubrobacteraceae bacterium]|nr:MarR family transcriptional regulator [Solirubrobacteraceae bacterium]